MARLDRPFFFGARRLVAAAALTAAACGGQTADLATDPDGREETALATAPHTLSTATPDQENLLAACVGVRSDVPMAKRLVDIVLVVDNSGSMTDEIVAVQGSINGSFADILGRSGLDYRVIAVARHGSAMATQSICISRPLSSIDCSTPLPVQPGLNPPRFYQYSVEIGSLDSFRRLIATYNGAQKDEFNLAPMGWSQWLRNDAFKVFIEITDDNSDLDENAFETQLFALSPKHFGDATRRNYVWHTIAGFRENAPSTQPWKPTDPVQLLTCTRGGGAVNSGQTYQRLSIKTGGLRFPICEHASFDAIFSAVASGVISGSAPACDFPLPTAPAGEKIDLSSVVVEYTAGSTGPATALKQVGNAAACAPGAFYIDKDRVYLCPDSCKVIQADAKPKVQVVYDCVVVPRPNGTACTGTRECTSGFCVDGVCCDSACGGGAADCQACSKAAGASADGTCSPSVAGTLCRPAAGPCDVAEACNGTATACPADKLRSRSMTCRASTGPCDTAEKCTGSSAQCPADKYASNTTVCRASAGSCDLVEFCTGTGASCPADQFKSVVAVCRPAAGACDLVDYCTGTSPACPPDDLLPAGTICRAATSSCDHDEICSGTSGGCPTDMSKPDGTACPGGSCSAGICK